MAVPSPRLDGQHKVQTTAGCQWALAHQPRGLFSTFAFPGEQRSPRFSSNLIPMDRTPKYDLRIDNVYFLKHVGATLRQATAGVPREELTEDMRLALRRLERREFLQNLCTGKSESDPAA
jgi:hypothetical protein